MCLRPNACCAIETAHCAGKAHTSGNLRPLLAKRRVIAPLVLGGRSLCCWSGANFQFGRTCRSMRALPADLIFVTLLISFMVFLFINYQWVKLGLLFLKSRILTHVFSHETEIEDARYTMSISSWYGHMAQNPACKASCAVDGKSGCENIRLSIFCASLGAFAGCTSGVLSCRMYLLLLLFRAADTIYSAATWSLPLDLTWLLRIKHTDRAFLVSHFFGVYFPLGDEV